MVRVDCATYEHISHSKWSIVLFLAILRLATHETSRVKMWVSSSGVEVTKELDCDVMNDIIHSIDLPVLTIYLHWTALALM